MAQIAPPDHFQEMARYNLWANATLFAGVADQGAAFFHQELNGFFGTPCGALNHLLLVDRLWLARLCDDRETLARYTRLDEILFMDPVAFQVARTAEDEKIIALAKDLDNQSLAQEFDYTTLSGGPMRSARHHVWTHLFNHGTHHRGQIHGMISQAGGNPPPLDLIFYLRDVAEGKAA